LSRKRNAEEEEDSQAYATCSMKRDFDRRHNPKRKKDMSQTQCFHCKKFGHFKAQCPKRFNEGRKE